MKQSGRKWIVLLIAVLVALAVLTLTACGIGTKTDEDKDPGGTGGSQKEEIDDLKSDRVSEAEWKAAFDRVWTALARSANLTMDREFLYRIGEEIAEKFMFAGGKFYTQALYISEAETRTSEEYGEYNREEGKWYRYDRKESGDWVRSVAEYMDSDESLAQILEAYLSSDNNYVDYTYNSSMGYYERSIEEDRYSSDMVVKFKDGNLVYLGVERTNGAYNGHTVKFYFYNYGTTNVTLPTIDDGNPDDGNPDGGNPDGSNPDDGNSDSFSYSEVFDDSGVLLGWEVTGYHGTDSNVTIPAEYQGHIVIKIGSYAFSGCTSLTSVTIPDSVTSISDYAFYGCTSLTSVTFGVGSQLTIIGDGSFHGCESLTSVTIPDSVTSIGSSAFSGCTSLTSMTIPDSVTSINSYAFSGCSSLTSVTIPDSVTSIGGWAFKDCASLNSVHISDIAAWCAIDFRNSDSNPLSYAHHLYLNGELVTELVIPDGVTSIGEYTFYGCSSLTSIEIPISVTSISSSAFFGCTGLTVVTIPDSVTSIGFDAFSSCANLTSVTIPDSVTSIDSYAFRGCTGLTAVTIPASVASIGSSAFWDCLSLTIYCEAASQPSGWESGWNWYRPVVWDCNKNDVADDGYIYAILDGIHYGLKDGEATVAQQSKTFTGEITIPDSVTYKGTVYPVTSIGDNAVSDCTGLTSVTIPDSVMSIGDWVFEGCTSLTSVTIPASVTSIGWGVFYGCTGLTSVTIPAGVTSIGGYLFYHCTNLTSVTIPAGVTIIGYRAFGDCSNLTSVTFGADSQLSQFMYIDAEAFSGCTSLTSVTIPDSVISIGRSAFYGCSSLTTVYYGGQSADWSGIRVSDSGNDELVSATRYYYSATEPTEVGNYWRYVDGVPTVW